MPTNAPPKAERAGETGDAGSFIPVNNPIESDHGRLKSRLRLMRGLKRLRSARVISAGHAFVQNIRRGHYELSVELDPQHRLPAAFAELTLAI
jgi:IS6 family transposase